MIKFLMRNKLQFFISISTDLAFFFIIIIGIALQSRTTDSYLLLMSIFLGVLSMHLIVILLRRNDKSKSIRIVLFSLLYVFGLRQISTYIIDPSDVLTVGGIIIGFLVYIYVVNTTDTIHNIRVKSRLVLENLDTK